MIIDESAYLEHYGILRKSGRYPWGSGGDGATQSPKTFMDSVDSLRRSGMSETDIARGMNMTTTELRAAKSIAKNEQKQSQISQAQRLKDKGYSNTAIGRRMGLPESTVRGLLAPGAKDRADVLVATSNMLKDQVAKKGFIDIGSGVEHHVGVSANKLSIAVARLKAEGYEVHNIQVDQLGTSNKTLVKVLAPPGTTYRDIVANKDKIRQITEHSDDGGRSYLGLRPPTQVHPNRVAVRYADEGGAAADGVVYIRRGVPELSLGGSNYAQVRIAVGGTHYIKGMAMYKDNMPEGADLVVNVNKKNTGNKLDALKEMKRDKDGNIDRDNPFGASIKPGGQRGAHNIVNEEGDWDKWSKSLSTQMLSKQSPSLAKGQLDMTYDRSRRELDDIKSLTNPAVRRKLLEGYADSADAAAVHLKAANLPRQSNHVILPVNSMKPDEIYAPNYRDGERVVLIRHPHGGVFEIPELTVNNRHPEAKRLLGRAKDAVGINSKVAERLSGADFDGDTVLVIPNNQGKVKTAAALAGLKNFDHRREYPAYPGMPKMTARTKAVQMGDITNLIADMTIQGANGGELARAVRHSMVVIDAEKHNLDYKSSAINNGIPQLKQKYQGSARAGASTLITRATSEKRVPERRPRSAAEGGPVDKATGKKVFVPTGATFVNPKTGKTVVKTTKSTKLAETDDAHTLSSGTLIEKVYAVHSNRMKALANEARKSAVNTKSTPYSPSAKAAYSKQVATLNAKLNTALRNSPLERQAQLLANTVVSQKRRANPDMEASELKRLKGQALQEARLRTGARKERINITPDEWAAIQAGAISTNKLKQILDNADLDQVKALATPKSASVMTASKKQRAQAMLASGYTQAEVADAIGVSLTTLKTELQ